MNRKLMSAMIAGAMFREEAGANGEANGSAATTKKEVVKTPVVMEDGTTVEFAGDIKAKKTIVGADKAALADGAVPAGVRFDFRNGKTRTIMLTDDGIKDLVARYAVHGISQKHGDQYASEKDVDDAVLAFDDLHDQTKRGVWSEGRTGSGFGGASILMKACMEAFKKTQEEVAAVLKEMSPKEKAALKEHESIKPIVKRLEDEKASKVDTAVQAAAVAKFG